MGTPPERQAPVTGNGPGVVDQGFTHAALALALVDAEGRFLRVNPALGALLGIDPEALEGTVWPELASPGRAPREHIVAPTSGRGRRLRVEGMHGPSAPFLVVVSDVTEAREAEDEREHKQAQQLHSERLRTLGQIATGIAHEINNPAAVAVAGVDLARRRVEAIREAVDGRQYARIGPLLESLGAALAYCEDGTLRMSQAARRLGVFSTLTGSEVEELDTTEVMGRALELVRNDLRHRARLVTDLQPVPRTWGSVARLTQAFTNLLLNAGQAIDGPPNDNVIAVATRPDGDGVVVEVRDTGIGMAEETRARLFDAGSAVGGRAALGLSVVSDVVHQHRGTIDVQSVRGRGTVFRLHLPADNGLAPIQATNAPAGRGRVLIVDDEPMLLELVREMLSDVWDVETAAGGEEALVLLARDSTFDVVLCDLMMPGVDGMAVHGWLRTHAPLLANRMVVATGGAFTDRADRWLRETGLRVIGKPFTPAVLLRTCAAAREGP